MSFNQSVDALFWWCVEVFKIGGALFYNNQEYFVEIIYIPNVKLYSCIGVINPD